MYVANKNKRKYLNLSISLFFYASLVYILINYFRDMQWQKVVDTKIDLKILCLAGSAFLGIRFLYPRVWVFILKEFGQKITNYWDLNFVYAKAWLGRYIPGKIAWVGGKIYFGSHQGLDIKTLILGSLLESIIQITASLTLGLFILSMQNRGNLDQRMTAFSLISLIILLLSTYPPFFNRVLKIAYKVFKKKEIESKYEFRFGTLIKTFLIFVVLGILLGIPAALICLSVDPAFDITLNFFYIVAALNIAGSIGILAVFAPAGLGVREGILAIFFSTLFSKEIVLVILIIMRLIPTLVDLSFFIISKVVLVYRSEY